MIKVFTERKLPFVWVGVPPMKNERASAAMLALNDIYRERVQKAVGSPLEPDVQGTATHEIPEQYLAADRARDVLGWSPRLSLDDALT